MQTAHQFKKISQIFPDSIFVRPEFDPEISGMSLDSRLVENKFLFVARKGSKYDGIQFIDEAIDRGAVVVLCEQKHLEGFYVHDSGCPIYCCEDLSNILGKIAERFFETNKLGLKIIGVTGTNGKTSICHFIAQALELSGFKVAVLGTAGNGFLHSLQDSALTTLDVLSLHKKISQFAHEGAQFVCMEVSSHSLSQNRIDGLRFECAVYSNLSQDHLDFHGSMTAYEQSKALLFKTEGLKNAVIRLDDAGERILNSLPESVSTLILGSKAQFDTLELPVSKKETCIDIDFLFQGERYQIQNRQLFGQFNIENLLLSFLALQHLGIASDKACEALAQVKPVKGRLQRIDIDSHSETLPKVFVDFAHTPEGLCKVLQSIRSIAKGKLILVFGCGGDRDKSKRPQMANIAEQLTDFVFVTSDNPRTENQEAISQQIISGFSNKFLEKVFVESNREIAIERAIALADQQDIVVVTGKGHEQYQLIQEKKIPFSDQLIVEQALLKQSQTTQYGVLI